jgi:O-antigen/teichoic acid export membrane protein
LQRYLENPYLRGTVPRSFVKNLLWLQAINWLVKPLWILWIERTVQVQLGNEWYGNYFVHFNTGLLFAVLLDAGLNSYIAREVAASGRMKHPQRMLVFRLILGGIYILLVGLFSWKQNLDWRILGFVVLNQILASLVLIQRSVLQGRHLFVSDGFLSVADRFVAILVSAWFLFGSAGSFNGLNGIVVFLTAQTAGYAFALLTGVYFLKFKKNASVLANEAVDETSWMDWFSEVKWYVMMALFMSVFTRIDALMIRNYSSDNGLVQAGLYAQGYRLLDAALIFSTLLSTQLLPLFSQKLSRKENAGTLVWGSFRLVLWVGLSASVVAFTYGDWILRLLYKEDTREVSYWIFSFLMTSFIPMAAIHVFGTFVTAMGKLNWLTGAALLGMAVNASFNFWLVPKLGAAGAALVCLLTQSVFVALCFRLALKSDYFGWRRAFTVKTLVVFSGFILFVSKFLQKRSVDITVLNESTELGSDFLMVLSFVMLMGITLFWEEIKKLR